MIGAHRRDIVYSLITTLSEFEATHTPTAAERERERERSLKRTL